MSETKDFNWKGEKGDHFAAHSPATAEATDRKNIEYYGITCEEMLRPTIKAMCDQGLDTATAKVLDIGCSTGGKLHLLERMGFSAKNLYGVDLSPKAVKICNDLHPDYNVIEVSGCNYEFEGVDAFDLVYNSAVMCQIAEDQYAEFYGKIKSLRPKFYMFIESINPRGYEKIPNSVVHHGHSEVPKSEYDPSRLKMTEGFHHVNNHEEVVRRMLPEAKPVLISKFHYLEEIRKKWFKPMHLEYCMVAAFKIQ